MCQKSEKNICHRIAQVRLEQDGPRGKSRFAKKLGISPSTYDCYESSRVPSAELLVKIAEIAHVDLRWLLTGEVSRENGGVSPQHSAVKRAAEMLGQYPEAAKPLGAFLDILAGTLAFPQSSQFSPKDIPAAVGGEGGDSAAVATQKISGTSGVSGISGSAAAPPDTGEAAHETSPTPGDVPVASPHTAPVATKADWIPILGRSAAGVPKFWGAGDDTSGLTTLSQLIEKHAAADEQMDIRPGVITCDFPPQAAPESVQIITLRTPDASGVVEFVAAGRIKAAYKDAFAVRIDGESMSPEIRHGDLLILSPSVPAVPYKPAVAQLRDAIGVTCKLYQPGTVDGVVNLVAINEQFASTTISLDDIQWALCVIAKIRTRP